MSIDAIFESIGELGKQQYKYCICLCLINCYVALHMLQYAFVSFPVEFQCRNAESNLTNRCPAGRRENCQTLQFSVGQSSSIVSEWSLVCDDDYKSKATMSAFMAGVMIGAFILGKLADQNGRKTCLLITITGILIFNGLSALATSYRLYVAFKFCVGFFCAGAILAMFVLGNELVGPSKRGVVGVSMQASFAVGIVLFSLLGYQVRQWRRLTLIISLLGTPALTLFWLLPESPRWLLGRGRTHEAAAVLDQIARGNGTALPEKLRAELEWRGGAGDAGRTGPRESLLALFSHPHLALLTTIQIFSWFVNSAAYYGLTLAAGSAGGGLYTATALSGAVEIPAYLLTNFLLDYLGRRRTLCLFMLVGGVACLAIQLLSSLAQSAALLGKLCLAASFAVVYVHSGEIFPTSIRNSAMGLVSVAARLGGILAPFIVALGDSVPDRQFIVFGVLSLAASLCNLLLPETLGAALPETVAEILTGYERKQRQTAKLKGDIEAEHSSMLPHTLQDT